MVDVMGEQAEKFFVGVLHGGLVSMHVVPRFFGRGGPLHRKGAPADEFGGVVDEQEGAPARRRREEREEQEHDVFWVEERERRREVLQYVDHRLKKTIEEALDDSTDVLSGKTKGEMWGEVLSETQRLAASVVSTFGKMDARFARLERERGRGVEWYEIPFALGLYLFFLLCLYPSPTPSGGDWMHTHLL